MSIAEIGGLGVAVRAGRPFKGRAFSPPATPLAKPSRLEAVDAFRLVAAFSTVLVHCTLSAESRRWFGPATRLSLPFFMQVAVYLLFRSHRSAPHEGLDSLLRRRTWRLLMPFAAWNAIYALLRIAKHALLVHDGGPDLTWSQAFTGTALHLWFLPFLTMATVIVLAILALVERWPRTRGAIIAILGAAGVIWCYIPLSPALQAPQGSFYFLQRTVLMGPSLCWATALGLWRPWSEGQFERNARTATIGVIVAVVALVILHLTVDMTAPFRLARHIGGLACLLAAMGPWRAAAVSAMARLGRCSYGIFLSHVMFVEGMQSLAAHRGLRPTWQTDLAVFAFGCLAATLRRSRWTRWIAG